MGTVGHFLDGFFNWTSMLNIGRRIFLRQAKSARAALSPRASLLALSLSPLGVQTLRGCAGHH